uniref:Uncharacterized protein n=1 Tax=Calcidiscus leptoporus TaxID=127549 RepID=A0A7S0IXJ5_9EUKA
MKSMERALAELRASSFAAQAELEKERAASDAQRLLAMESATEQAAEVKRAALRAAERNARLAENSHKEALAAAEREQLAAAAARDAKRERQLVEAKLEELERAHVKVVRVLERRAAQDSAAAASALGQSEARGAKAEAALREYEMAHVVNDSLQTATMEDGTQQNVGEPVQLALKMQLASLRVLVAKALADREVALQGIAGKQEALAAARKWIAAENEVAAARRLAVADSLYD